MTKVSKLPSGVPESKLNCPPNNCKIVHFFFILIWATCMPSKAKMRMKRKRRKRRERMERMELRREMTRLRRLAQYFVTFNTNQVIFARISGHLEDPQEPECAENG